MSNCSGCGAETKRVRTIFRGAEMVESCPQCKPEEFERWVDPSNTHGGFRYQYEPQKYIKREMPDGRVLYEATEERNADLEADLMRPNQDEACRGAEAIARKRANRRTKPLSSAELEIALNRARRKLQPESPLAI